MPRCRAAESGLPRPQSAQGYIRFVLAGTVTSDRGSADQSVIATRTRFGGTLLALPKDRLMGRIADPSEQANRCHQKCLSVLHYGT